MKTSYGITAILLVTFGFLISIGGLAVRENIIYICGMILMIIGTLVLWSDYIKKLFSKSQNSEVEEEQ